MGDIRITDAEFYKAYQPALDKLYSAQEQNPTSQEIQLLKQQVLDRLVDDAIMEQTAQKLGLNVTNEELAATIQRQSYFSDENGHFDKAKYFQILQANQLTVEDFETEQREEMLLQKVRSVLMDGVLYSDAEVTHYGDFLNRDLKSVYTYMDPSVYEKAVTYTEDDLKNYYENNRTRYDHAERAKVRHILLSTQGSNPLDEDKVKQTLEDYRQQILSGKATFADLAKKYSQDNGSKIKGGELGWLTRGETVKEFEDAVFGLKKGDITKPFKSQFGYHIAQLEDYQQAYKSTFEEVKAEVTKQYCQDKAEQKMIAISAQLAEKMKQNADLAKVAGELGLPVESSDWFNQNKDIPHLKDSKSIALQLAGLYLEQWKGPFSLNKKEYFFQITDTKENKLSPEELKKDRSDIATQMLYQRQDAWLKDFLDDQKKKMGVKTYLD